MSLDTQSPLDIAVIGGGAAGLAASFLLQRRHKVTLFEQADRLGGHAHTVVVPDGPDAGLALDVGFMVFNDRNYPSFHTLLEKLGVTAFGPGDMSFGYQDAGRDLGYVIDWATPGNTAIGPAPALLAEIWRFLRRASRDLESGNLEGKTLADYVAQRALPDSVVEDYLVPLSSALWSTPPGDVLACPAPFVLRFLDQHGLLFVEQAPTWQTLIGGSRVYVEALAKALKGVVKTRTGVESLSRNEFGCRIVDKEGITTNFDAVVVATHADQALRLLADPDPAEARALSPWRYQVNEAVLHTDSAILPQERRLWAGWNYARSTQGGPRVTYHLNRLQGHAGARSDYFLSLNPGQPVTDAAVMRTMTFTHPVFSLASLAAQRELPALNASGRTFYCGSYFGNGFHEDAVRSAFDVAIALGAAA